MTPAWVSRYVGLSFQERGRDWNGVDCWGLCQLVYRDRLGVELPYYIEQYRTTTDEAEISSLIKRETGGGPWRQVEPRNAQELDVLIFRMRGAPMHCAIVVAPGTFLHIGKGINAVLERWESPTWLHRMCSAWRYRMIE